MQGVSFAGVRAVWLGVAGLAVGCATVVVGARTLALTTTPPTSWFGLLPVPGYAPEGSWAFGALLLAGVVLLVVLWAVALGEVRAGRLQGRLLVAVAAAWQAPFVLGPPLISKDAWAYVAHGSMLRRHIDVYAHGIAALSRTAGGPRAVAAVRAVDPTWRHVASPYGPVTSLLEHAAVAASDGHPLGAVMILRVLVVAAVAVTAWACARLAPQRKDLARAIVALNPLVLVHAISGAHLDMIMAALVACAVVAALHAGQRGRAGWPVAVACVCVAGSVKAPAFAALPALLVAHVATARRMHVARRVAADLVAAAVSTGACALLVPDGFGWLRNLDTPGQGNRPTSPSALLSALLGRLGPDAADGDTLVRLAVLALAAAVVLYLAATARSRQLPITVAASLLVLAFAGPVFYPWYLLWGLLLVPLDTARRRLLVVAASAAGCLVAITGLPRGVTAGVDAVLAAAAVAVFVTLARGVRDQRASEPIARAASGQSVNPASIADDDHPRQKKQNRESGLAYERASEARQERL